MSSRKGTANYADKYQPCQNIVKMEGVELIGCHWRGKEQLPHAALHFVLLHLVRAVVRDAVGGDELDEARLAVGHVVQCVPGATRTGSPSPSGRRATTI